MSTPKTIRILTFNAFFPPTEDSRKRAERIASAILAATPRFDVVCLQEVFMDGPRAVFAKRLKKQFPHLDKVSASANPFNQDSGLFFASRFPIVNRTFVEFAHAEPFTWDAMADKGLFGALLDLSPDFPKKELFVFNTHLQSSRVHYEVRAKQVDQIRRVIARSVKGRKAAAVLCGDLNVIAEDASLLPTTEYARTVARLGYPRDLFREANPATAGLTWDSTKNKVIPKDDDDHERLDYVFAFDHVPQPDDDIPRQPIPRLFSQTVELAMIKNGLSDHFGVAATVSFSART